jgi:2-polyprenyl-3-methyl-5-hydroxy-6-metoxy-1,4-benzoquinol methylase
VFALLVSAQILQKSDDLKTNACTTDSGLPPHVKAIFPLLADEVIARYYGCGIVVPELLDGCSVLDLGCGAGALSVASHQSLSLRSVCSCTTCLFY